MASTAEVAQMLDDQMRLLWKDKLTWGEDEMSGQAQIERIEAVGQASPSPLTEEERAARRAARAAAGYRPGPSTIGP